MKKLDADAYAHYIKEFMDRRNCPNCEATEHDQGFIDGVSFCMHLVRFFAEEEGYEQITLEEILKEYR